MKNCCCRWLTRRSNLEEIYHRRGVRTASEHRQWTWEEHGGKTFLDNFFRVAVQHNLVGERFPRVKVSVSQLVYCFRSWESCAADHLHRNNEQHPLLSAFTWPEVNSQRSDLHFFLVTRKKIHKESSIDVVDALLMSQQPKLVTFRF